MPNPGRIAPLRVEKRRIRKALSHGPHHQNSRHSRLRWLLRGRLGVVVNASAARADSIRPALFKHPQPGRQRGGRTVSDVRFLPRWQQLEKTAFWYAERAARAPRAAERDRLLAHALAAWRASRDVEKMVLCFSILCLGSESRALPGTLPIFLSRTLVEFLLAPRIQLQELLSVPGRVAGD